MPFVLPFASFSSLVESSTLKLRAAGRYCFKSRGVSKRSNRGSLNWSLCGRNDKVTTSLQRETSRFEPLPVCAPLTHLFCNSGLWQNTPLLALSSHLDAIQIYSTHIQVWCGMVWVVSLSVSHSFCLPSLHKQHTRGLREPTEMNASLKLRTLLPLYILLHTPFRL